MHNTEEKGNTNAHFNGYCLYYTNYDYVVLAFTPEYKFVSGKYVDYVAINRHTQYDITHLKFPVISIQYGAILRNDLHQQAELLKLVLKLSLNITLFCSQV